ncbi:hypothetical protein BDK51DRAFT_3485, partial [Blyttiomyces helicus]
YTVLNTLEFSSARRRMSVIVRVWDGRILLICKGADTVILERLQPESELTEIQRRDLEWVMQDMAAFATEGLRTLLYARREIGEEEYRRWSARYSVASTALLERARLMDSVAESIERDLVLLGGTAVED